MDNNCFIGFNEYKNLNEVLVGKLDGVEIFMNPPTIKRLGPWVRAVTDIHGNLFISENYEVIHSNMIKMLIRSKALFGDYYKDYYKDYNVKWGYRNLVCWQRLNKTNKLYLSESYHRFIFDPEYSEYIDQIKKWSNKVVKNRPDIEFIYEQIEENWYL